MLLVFLWETSDLLRKGRNEKLKAEAISHGSTLISKKKIFFQELSEYDKTTKKKVKKSNYVN